MNVDITNMNNAKPFSKRKEEVITFITKYKEVNSKFPSVRDIGKEFNISYQSVSALLTKLHNLNTLKKDEIGRIVWIETEKITVADIVNIMNGLYLLKKEGEISTEKYLVLKNKIINQLG